MIGDQTHVGHHGNNQHYVDGFVTQRLWDYLPDYPKKEVLTDKKILVTFYAMRVI